MWKKTRGGRGKSEGRREEEGTSECKPRTAAGAVSAAQQIGQDINLNKTTCSCTFGQPVYN